jgi:hypothetical protein
MSNEHPGLTPVFGDTVPSKGMARLIRDYAYQYGEATSRHWMLLMMANRVDVLETMIADALRGRPDHYIKEKGWSAKMKYDEDAKRSVIVAGVVLVGAIGLGVALSRMMRRD